MKRKIQVTRGEYGQITQMPPAAQKKCKQLLDGVRHAAKIDEHGGWEFGVIASDYRKGRFHSLDYDWYAVGHDIHDEQFLAIVQVREFYRRKASAFAEIRKSYFLLGKNEDRTFFAHPVEARVIHHAIRKNNDVLKAVQDWIFDCDYSLVKRQGDLCIIPVRSVKGDDLGTKHVLQESHQLIAAQILQNGALYAINPTLVHLPGTHPTIQATGKYKIVVGKRASFWSFAKPTLD